MLLGFLLFGALGEPLLPTQLLWINLITDGLPAIALGLDRAVPGIMSLPPDRGRNLLAGPRQLRLLGQGAILAASTLVATVYGHFIVGAEWPYVRTMVFTTLVVVQLFHAFNVRAEGPGVWKVGFGGNRTLLVAALIPVGLQLGIVYLPLGNRLFSTVAIRPVEWLVILGLGVVSFLAVSAFEHVVEKRRVSASPPGADQGAAGPDRARQRR